MEPEQASFLQKNILMDFVTEPIKKKKVLDETKNM